MNPYVFIVGCPRSGTTMLERMVNAHPEIAIIHETHWITKFFKKRIGLDASGFVNQKLVDAISGFHRFHLLKTTRADLQNILSKQNRPLNYSEFVSQIFDEYGAQEGKRIVGDKTTGGYLRNLKVLHRLFPGARFVHLVRDGRNVCLSMVNWKKADRAAGRLEIWNENPIATTALWWRWQLQKGLKNAASIPKNLFYEIRFESLVKNPEQSCRQLCRFLDIEFDDAMVKFHEGKTRMESGLTANRAWLPPTPNLRDWRTQMSTDDIELFEAVAGDLLAELGYQRMFETISPEVERTAIRFRQWWNTERHAEQHVG